MTAWGGHYRPRFTTQRMCPMCGDYFETTRKDTQTCGPRCRKRLQRVMNSDMETRTEMADTPLDGLSGRPKSP